MIITQELGSLQLPAKYHQLPAPLISQIKTLIWHHGRLEGVEIAFIVLLVMEGKYLH